MKKKISILLPSLRGGGAEKVMVTLANYFVERGYEIDLLLLKKEGTYLNRLSDKINIINLNSSRALFSISKILQYLKKTDTYVLLTASTYINLIAIICKLLLPCRKIRVVISERSIISNSSKNSKRSFFRFISFAVHILYPNADSIIAISNGVKEDLVEFANLDRNLIDVIYNPLTIDSKYDSIVNENIINEINRIKGSDDNVHLLISVGRLEKVKNYSLLIDAFKILKEKRKLKLIILGTGIQQENILNQISKYNLINDIFLLGFKQNPIPYMKKSDVFVLTSNWEGFGNVLVEAMSVGLKIVSTDCPSGPKEILENGKWGKLVPLNDAFLLAKAIDEILECDVKYNVKERAAFFSLERIAPKYLEILFKDSH